MYNQPETIAEQYDMKVSQISKGRGTYICDTDSGMKVLSPFYGSQLRAEFIKESLAAFAGKGYRIEQIYPTKEGEVFSQDDAGTNYLLKDFFTGSECSTKNREDLEKATEALAKFHCISAACDIEIPGYLSGTANTQLSRFERHARELLKVRNYIKKSRKKNEFEMKFMEWYGHFSGYANKTIEMLKKEEVYEGMHILCHGDFNQHNVIKTKEGVVIVNFDSLCHNLPVSDLANFMRKILEKNNWNEDLGFLLIQGYEKARRLSEKELNLLYIFMLFPEKFWKLANHYSSSHKTWLSGRDLEKLDRIIEQEKERISFLEKLFHFKG